MKKLEKPIKESVKLALIFCAIGILLGTIISFAATPSSTFYITGGVYPGAPTYTIWKEGSNYFAKDSNGQLHYSGTDASLIIQNCIDAVGNSSAHIHIKCSNTPYIIDSTIVVNQKYIQISGDGLGMNGTFLKLADNANQNIFNLSSATLFSLRNLMLGGNYENNLDAGIGVWSDYPEPTADVYFDHVAFQRFREYGFYLIDCWNTIVSNSYCESNGIAGAKIGVMDCLISGSAFNWNYGYGLELSGTPGGITMTTSHVCENYKHGIYVHPDQDVTLTANIIRGNGVESANTYDGIHVTSGNDNITITANVIDGRGFFKAEAGTAFSRFGIKVDSEEGTVVGNTITNCATDEISVGSGVMLEANWGYPTENCGTATFATGNTVTHGLAETPTSVIVTATITGLSDIYVSDINPATFKINFAGGGDGVFYWYAEYQP